jgi:hypothetical protein
MEDTVPMLGPSFSPPPGDKAFFPEFFPMALALYPSERV